MFTAQFVRDAAERAIKTAAQALLIAVGAAQGADLFALNWTTAAAAAAGGFVLSVLTSLVSAPFGPKGSPSLTTIPDSTTTDPAPSNGSEQAPLV